MNFQQIQFAAIAVAAIIVGYMIYKILNYFGIIGTSKEEIGKKELLDNPAIQGDSNSFLPLAGAAFQKKYGRKAGVKDIQLITPLAGTLTTWRKQLVDARGLLNDNESAVLNVFRNIKSKLALYAFAQNFQVYVRKSLVDYLNEFLDEDELSQLNDIIKKMPTI